VRNNARTLIVSILALVGTFLSDSSALADDYSVDFGIESDAGKDAGSIGCVLEQACGAEIESLGLRVTFHAFRREPGRAIVSLYSGDPGCCYFSGGAGSITIDPRTPLSRIPLFKGARARGGLYIENQRVGILYLRFHSR
jgi:hypothetical protein